MNIYLDIDGVLLANDHTAANFADDFLQFVLRRFPDSTYWLTTHCWRGENRAVDVLTPFLKQETIELLNRIKPTEWGDIKTEAIDFKKPFFWFDDDLYPEERKILEDHEALKCLRKIDLGSDQHQLMEEIHFLIYFTGR